MYDLDIPIVTLDLSLPIEEWGEQVRRLPVGNLCSTAGLYPSIPLEASYKAPKACVRTHPLVCILVIGILVAFQGQSPGKRRSSVLGRAAVALKVFGDEIGLCNMQSLLTSCIVVFAGAAQLLQYRLDRKQHMSAADDCMAGRQHIPFCHSRPSEFLYHSKGTTHQTPRRRRSPTRMRTSSFLFGRDHCTQTRSHSAVGSKPPRRRIHRFGTTCCSPWRRALSVPSSSYSRCFFR